MIHQFIECLKELEKTKNPLFNVIKHPQMFFEAINELDKMIGMEDVKNDIIKLIKVLMIRKDNRLLHTMILGDPGTGKTVLGYILCKILTSLNLITKPDTLPSQDSCKKQCSEPEISRNIRIQQENIITIFNTLDLYNRRLHPQDIRKPNVDQFIRDIRNIKIGIDSILPKKVPILNPEIIYKIASRSDFVSEYLGQTSIKTRNFLDSAMGGVVFIDEAYELYQNGYSGGDAYGMEALTVIIEYMTKYQDNIVIIFGGYESTMKNTILKSQRGLKSRIGNCYKIKPYTSKQLADIFKLQLKDKSWSLGDIKDEQLIKLLDKKVTNGRDTQNLVARCIDAHATISFDKLLRKESISFLIDENMIQIGIDNIDKINQDLSKKKFEPPYGIYV